MTTKPTRSPTIIDGDTARETKPSVREIGSGLFDLSLPRARWNHEAHLAAAIYVLELRPEWNAHTVMPEAIRRYNQHHGVANTDHGGFHATITEFYLRVIADFLDRLDADRDADAAFRAVLRSPLAHPDFPLRFYSTERLYSVAARRRWVAPDFLSLSRYHLTPTVPAMSPGASGQAAHEAK